MLKKLFRASVAILALLSICAVMPPAASEC